ncbi:MAG: LytTR family DNA-binding domain-containing protein [Cytophagales bacterium]|nr:LytTR family DNA-binding domain-containing protein [Cytophagales bacterium]
MEIVIIDDEKQAVASLEMELNAVDLPIQIIGRAYSVKEGIHLLQELTPDILFLDIRLQDGLGFDILHEIPNFGKFHLVFTTAYDQYALDAFRHHAFDYLLKPIDPDELQATLERIQQLQQQETRLPVAQLEQIVALSNAISPDTKIALNTGQGIYLKQLSKVIHIQAFGNYSKFYFEGDEMPMVVSKTLKEFEEMLSNEGFLRVHQSTLINLAHLESYHHQEGNYVVMSNQETLTVSTRKKPGLLKILKGKVLL